MKKWTLDHKIGISGILLGTAIALAVPLWSTYLVETPNLNVDVTSIARDIAPNSGIILGASEELSFLEEFTRTSAISRLIRDEPDYSGKKRFNSDELLDLLDRAKEEFRGLTEKIENNKKNVERVSALTPTELSFSMVSSLNRPLPSRLEVEVDRDTFRTNRADISGKKTYFMDLRDKFEASYTEILESNVAAYQDLSSKIPSATREIEKIQERLQKFNSFFKVSAVVSNSGRASSSLKQQALMRVYIGSRNYVDLELEMQEYQKVAQISEYGAKIVTYYSDQISSFPEEDQKLINTYWGQSVPAVLFQEDITSRVVTSNEITFSEGLNEKMVIDRLKGAAGRRNDG